MTLLEKITKKNDLMMIAVDGNVGAGCGHHLSCFWKSKEIINLLMVIGIIEIVC